jgi:hypothetical protein
MLDMSSFSAEINMKSDSSANNNGVPIEITSINTSSLSHPHNIIQGQTQNLNSLPNSSIIAKSLQNEVSCQEGQNFQSISSNESIMNTQSESITMEKEGLKPEKPVIKEKKSPNGNKRGKYRIYTEEDKAKIIEQVSKLGLENVLADLISRDHKITRRKLKGWIEGQTKVKGSKI